MKQLKKSLKKKFSGIFYLAKNYFVLELKQLKILKKNAPQEVVIIRSKK